MFSCVLKSSSRTLLKRFTFCESIASRALSIEVPIHCSYEMYKREVQRSLYIPNPYNNVPPTVAAKVGRWSEGSSSLHRKD